jgi:molybdopterin synthase sulfur carrier subunit
MMNNTAVKLVQIQYFAVLREQRGLSIESVTTSAGTLRELYTELAAEHGFALPCERLRVAVNDEFQSWDDQLQGNARVVFIPPVAGG